MQIVPLTAEHLEAPMWDSSDEFEQMLGRLQWHLHTPYARAFCAVAFEEEVAGIATAVRFGDSARITACKLVTGFDATAARVGLVNTLLDALHNDGCTAFSITVAPDQVEHWKAFEFVPQENLLRYTGGKFYEATYPDVVWIEPQHRMAVMHLDRQASGEDRHALLLEHEYIGRVYMDGNTVRGFALALLGNSLIVADTPSVGLELQRWIFPTQDYLFVPEGNATAHAHLLERGYTAAVAGVRMVRGEARTQRIANIFGEPFGAV